MKAEFNMKISLTLILISAGLSFSFAQTDSASFVTKVEAGLDSLSSIKLKLSRTDTLKSKLLSSQTRLKGATSKLDSISGKAGDFRPINKIDSLQILLTQRINSLSVLPNPDKLPIKSLDSARGNLDSLRNSITDPVNNTLSKVNETQSKINASIGSIENKVNEKLIQVTGKGIKLGTLKLPNDKKLSFQNPLDKVNANVQMPKLGGIDNISVPSLKGVGLSPGNIKAPQLPNLKIGSLPNVGNLSSLTEKVGDISEKLGEVSKYTQDIKAIRSGDLNEVEKVVENNIGAIDEVQKIQAEVLPASKQLELIKKWNSDPEVMKEMAVNKAKEEAINHFAGHEKQLMAVMDKMGELKKVYAKTGTVVDLFKTPRQIWREKPMIEKVIPGIAIQVHVKNFVNFDFNPYAGIQITRNVVIGAGWNHRFAMQWSTKSWRKDGSVYGPRGYVEYKLPKGFGIRVEGEWMNSIVPPHTISSGDGNRQWVFSSMTGLKKEYKFFGKVKGFTIVQFDLIRLIKPNHNSPYADVVNTRFGFEFPMKKKAAKQNIN